MQAKKEQGAEQTQGQQTEWEFTVTSVAMELGPPDGPSTQSIDTSVSADVGLQSMQMQIETDSGPGTIQVDGEGHGILTYSGGEQPVEPEPEPEPIPPEEIIPPPEGEIAPGWVVAPDGDPYGNGTAESPWTLSYAFQGASGTIQPGDTVYLRGGTYTHQSDADGDIQVSGQEGNPITFRSYPGEWAVIDSGYTGRSGVRFFGSDVTVRDVEIQNSDPARDVGQQGRSDLTYWKGPRCKLINCVLHDGGNAVGFWQESTDSEVYGCLIYNNGMWETDEISWGHSFYVQNLEGATKRIRANVAINPFRNGIDVYSATEAGGAGVIVEDNVVAHPGGGFRRPGEGQYSGLNGVFSPGGPAADFEFNRNIMFCSDNTRTNWIMNYADHPNVALECNGNEFHNGGATLGFGHWDTGSVSGNRLVSEYYLVDYHTQFHPTNFAALGFDNNEYFWAGGAGGPQFGFQGEVCNFEQWKTNTGADANSSFTESFPTDLRMRVIPNTEERGRGWIYVVDYTGSGAVRVKFDELGLQDGEAFEVIDAQNWPGGAIATGNFRAGEEMVLPLQSEESPQPFGHNHHPYRDPRLNIFLVCPAK